MTKAKDLEEALTNIEIKLGGEKKSGLKDLGEHLEYIESLIGGGASGGTKLYKHNLSITDNNNDNWTFEFISKNDSAYSVDSIIQWADIIKAGQILNISHGFPGYYSVFISLTGRQFNGYGFESEDSAEWQDFTIICRTITDTVTLL